MALSDIDFANIVKSEEQNALDYEGEIAQKRAKLMDYYNCQPYGDEQEGQSQAVTSDVADVVEWMIPALIRLFTQGQVVGKFRPTVPGADEEAEQKTMLSNYSFMEENNGVLTLHNAFKDALLQFTGTVKVTWDDSEDVRTTKYQGLSELELRALMADPNVKVQNVEFEDTEQGRVFDAERVEINKSGKVCYENVPPEEFLVTKTARDFERPSFVGQRSPKRRSELIEMGFDRKLVDTLSAYDYYEGTEQKAARYHDYNTQLESNTSNHSPNDIIYLGEYYIEIDNDGDGITEYWKVFFAGDRVLEKEQVDDHPFAVLVPVPIPHRAIGTCPAEQVADIQYRKSVMLRQALDNTYFTNYPRVMHSNKVDLEDLLSPRAGGSIGVDTEMGDVAGHAQPLVVPNMVDGVMKLIEYTDMEREIRTGITRYSQGLDAESLNKTATGFRGIMDASQQRLELVARLFASGGIRQIFEKTIALYAKYQDTPKQIEIFGKPMEINPKQWAENTRCVIDVGLGSGDRQEKIMNLNNILQLQSQYRQEGLLLVDQAKMYNTLSKLIDEIGLKDPSQYFNDPERPEEVLAAQLEIALNQVELLQAQINQNPLAEAEMIKAQAKMMEAQGKQTNDWQKFVIEQEQKAAQFDADQIKDYTEMELKYGRNVPDSKV